MKVKGSLTRARITFFFKETFRAHSKSEYREVFTRGIGEDKRGITGSMPWLYVRAFFVLFILFTVNVLILRFTENPFYVPTVTLFGGVTFSIRTVRFFSDRFRKRLEQSNFIGSYGRSCKSGGSSVRHRHNEE